jgi:hypothetical protein
MLIAAIAGVGGIVWIAISISMLVDGRFLAAAALIGFGAAVALLVLEPLIRRLQRGAIVVVLDRDSLSCKLGLFPWQDITQIEHARSGDDSAPT